MEGRVAKDRTGDGVVAKPQFFGSGLIAARRTSRDDAYLVRPAKIGLQGRQYRAESGRIDAVARPFELNALEAVRCLVHLEKHHHRDAADQLARQDDIGVTVSKVESVG